MSKAGRQGGREAGRERNSCLTKHAGVFGFERRLSGFGDWGDLKGFRRPGSGNVQGDCNVM